MTQPNNTQRFIQTTIFSGLYPVFFAFEMAIRLLLAVTCPYYDRELPQISIFN